MYFPDLGTDTQILGGPHVRAVGWLDASVPFATSPPGEALVDRLSLFRSASAHAVEALSLWVAGGPHRCQFCERHHDGVNFAVPAETLLYVCPGMVGHYVGVHRYSPPKEFVEAIFDCPDPGTTDYFERCFRFNEHVANKHPALRSFLARVLANTGLASGRKLALGPGGACSIWLRDHGTPERETRVQITLDEHTGSLFGRVGHAPRHRSEEFVVDDEFPRLSLETVTAIVAERFKPYRHRKARPDAV
ncbi:MAG: hypothetical protein R3B72_09220 [Polyangiaceae bacterium]